MPSYARTALCPAYKRPPPGGYRKTARKQGPRRARPDLPPWRARFVLDGAKVICPGHVDLAGAEVTILGRCVIGEVTGANRDWCLRQAETLASKLGYDHRPVWTEVTRDQPGQVRPVIARPFERGDPNVVAIGRSQVVDATAMRPMRI